MPDLLENIFVAIITLAVIGFIFYLARFLFFQIPMKILYYFKTLKMTPVERAYEKRIRKRKSQQSSNGWWTFDSGSGSADCGDSGGGDCGGGGGD
ncbi:MAG TPA: hypothetical protein VNQ57_00365 [Ureibacillus sp.]|nr:hypothetical protein [Ureibacillus sp.]